MTHPNHRFAHGGETLVTRDDNPRTWVSTYNAFTRSAPVAEYEGILGDGVNWVATWMDERADADPSMKDALRLKALDAIRETYPEAIEYGTEFVGARGSGRGLVHQPRCPDDVQDAMRAIGLAVVHSREAASAALRSRAASWRATVDVTRSMVGVLAAAIDAGDEAAQRRWAAWVADPSIAAAREVEAMARGPR